MKAWLQVACYLIDEILRTVLLLKHSCSILGPLETHPSPHLTHFPHLLENWSPRKVRSWTHNSIAKNISSLFKQMLFTIILVKAWEGGSEHIPNGLGMWKPSWGNGVDAAVFSGQHRRPYKQPHTVVESREFGNRQVGVCITYLAPPKPFHSSHPGDWPLYPLGFPCLLAFTWVWLTRSPNSRWGERRRGSQYFSGFLLSMLPWESSSVDTIFSRWFTASTSQRSFPLLSLQA